MMAPERPTILAVDDNADSLYALERILAHAGFQVIAVSSGEDALEKARLQTPDVLLLDVMMPKMDGYEVTKRFKGDRELRFVPVMLLSAKDSLEDVVKGLEHGADGYITKPFRPEELIARVRAALRLCRIYQELKTSTRQNEELLEQLSSGYSFESIIGRSPAMQQIFALLSKVALADSAVLITGASGTGKELIARAIHFNSARRSKLFLAKNCAAFSEHLLESELFGHVRGAFTGALRDHKGLFEAADGGTLFLDEIGEMSPVLQAKLLRVLQEGTFIPVGSHSEKRADVRVLAATNRHLPTMVEQGSFREDLYYRLNVINIHLPPLSERREDIPLLVAHFLQKAAERRGGPVKQLSREALALLMERDWKGNVRELQNEIERMLILGNDQTVLDPSLLSPAVSSMSRDTDRSTSPTPGRTLRAAIEELERKMLGEALVRLHGNRSAVAKELGMSRSNLIAKIQQYGLEEKTE